MTAHVSDDDVQPRLMRRLRAALVPVLSSGSWSQIAEDHSKVGLAWRDDLRPHWGKPKYLERVLDDTQDEQVLAVARRTLERFPERCRFELEDALLWIDAKGSARVSELTRLRLAKALEGHRLHPDASPDDVLGKFAHSSAFTKFKYDDDGTLYFVEVDPLKFFSSGFAEGASKAETIIRSSQLALFDAYAFRHWPDMRLFRLVEYLVHPTVRQTDEQTFMVKLLNDVLVADGFELSEVARLSGAPVFKVRPRNAGVSGRPKNLIFASTGPKPELGFVDAVNNDIVILLHGEHCLIYDEAIADGGLPWVKLVDWWARRERLDPSAVSTRKSFADRLEKSLVSNPERFMFWTYFRAFRGLLGERLPALVPQVYLHYDPLTLRELRARGDSRRLDVQRMDFLLLLPHNVRVVVEIDGQQHYSTGADASAKPSPEEYARTVRADRNLRLAGYEVYRFGGYELRDDIAGRKAVDHFFRRLFRRHGLL